MTTSRFFVTGATGQLGGLVIAALLETLPARRIVAGVRDLSSDRAAALRETGIEIREADYTRPETLLAAFAGIEKLLLISGNDIGHRVEQHRNVIDAAKASGVGLVVYTSILRARTSPLFLANEHRETEDILTESGVPYVILRNGWYSEVHTWRLPVALKSGQLLGASGEGPIASAARADYARAAAVVLAGGDHAGRIYELAGDESVTLADVAAIVAREAGRPLGYRDLAPDALEKELVSQGVPAVFAHLFADTDVGAKNGALFDDGRALSRLIGRATTPVATTISDFLKTQAAEP